ncbi:MAG: helix-turn-helix domain-containing protein [Candidatus Moraniibacteriota bacterium]
MQNILIQKLIDAGLEEKEAILYIAILELGEATIAKISQKSNIKRSTVYDTLEKLKKIGMISQTNKGKRPIFLAENPEKLIESLETKKRTLQESMPEILSIMNLLDKKPRIRYFEGLAGVKEVFEDTLKYPDQEILTWFPYPYINLGEEYFSDYYHPERNKKKIWVRAIVPDTKKNREFAEEIGKTTATRTKFVSDELFNKFDIEIKIYGKIKFGIISYKESLGIIIESQKIHEGMKAIFEGMWNLLPDKPENNHEKLTENEF